MRHLSLASAILISMLARPAAAETTPSPPPYQADLLRLAEVMGAISYADHLCSGSNTDVWRAKMSQLLEAQGLRDVARRPYVAAFNRGHRTTAAVHRTCTEQTRSILDRYFAEGAALADRLDLRYGGGNGAKGWLPGN